MPVSHGRAESSSRRLRQNATGQHTSAYFGGEQFGSVLVETRYVASSLGTGPNSEPFEFGVYTAFAVAADPGAGYLCLVTGDAPGNNPGTLRLVTTMHWFLLALSLVTVAGAVAGSHGVLLFTAS